jgi:Tfp pilus assembly protein PilF
MFSVARYLLIVLVLLLQACATTRVPNESVVVDEQAVAYGQTSSSSQTAAAITNLFEQSKSHVVVGNFDEGARVLERALRIEPANAETWYRMAKIKYLQTDYVQAAVTALRSNTFVGSNNSLRLLNLTLMLDSYKALGDTLRADSVRTQIANIQQP